MNPQLRKKIDKEIAAFEAALKSNNGQPLTRYELAVLVSYLRYKLQLEIPAE